MCRAEKTVCGIFFILLFVVFSLHGQQENPRSRITAASEPDYPPYCYVDDSGNAAGFSVELFKSAAAAMKIETEIEIGLWNDIKQELAEGKIDALPLVGRTPERETIFDFTIPYLSLYGGIVVQEDNREINNLNDLRGKRVAVMKGDNAEEFLRRQETSFEIITTPTFSDAMNLLSEGLCDAVVIQRLVGLRIILEEGFSDLRVLNEPIYEFRQDFCFAVQEGDKELLALLNEGLALVMADGTFRRLHAQWFAATELPSRKIIVGGDHDYPPFEFLDEKGRPSGYNTELTRAIARELGLDIEIFLGPWPLVLDMIERGEIDVLQGLFYSSERDKRFDFSQPHTVNHGVAVIRSGEGKAVPKTVEELAGKSILVQEGDIMHDLAVEKDLGEYLTVVETQEEALRLLSSGEYDCALASRLTALYLIDKNGWKNLIVGNRSLSTHEYGYAVKEGNKVLLSHFSQGLAVVEDTGEYHRIYDKWLGVYKPIAPSFADVFRYVAIVALPLLIGLGGFFLWTRSLRRVVALRTAELRTSEKQYRLLAENTVDVIWLMSPDLRFTYVNPSIELLTGHTPQEWVGSNLRDHCNEEDFKKMAEVVEKAINMLPDNSGITFEAEMTKKNGDPVSVEIIGKVLLNEEGGIEGLQGVTRDITERKRAEAELKRHQNRLEELVEEKTRELNERVTELERFHDATVDRELRMKELRDEIKRLKGGGD